MGEEIQQLGLSKDANEIPSYPEADAHDYVHRAVDFGASLVIPGGDKILAAIVGPSLSKRRDEWLQMLGEKVQELLRQERLTLEDLQENERFVDVVIQATQIALKTGQKEKHEALKNAIVNVALDSSLDEVLCHMSLNLIDTLTPTHVLILKYFDDLEQHSKEEFEYKHQNGVFGNPVDWYLLTYPGSNYELVTLVYNDLDSSQLLKPWAPPYAPEVSKFGSFFLKYISPTEIG